MYAKPHLAAVRPYVPGYQPERPDVVKLNSNENPYPPSPNVKKALVSLDCDRLRRYPDASCSGLRRMIADRYGVEPGCVFCGNGSDEIISLLFRGFLGKGDAICLPSPTYTFYRTAAAVHEVRCFEIPTREDFTVDATTAWSSSTRRTSILPSPAAPPSGSSTRFRI